jgi:hypothetical protein
MVFALALTGGCGQQGGKRGATGSEGQNSTITDNSNAKQWARLRLGRRRTPDVGEADNRNPEMRDGKYVYEVDGTEFLCKTNIWIISTATYGIGQKFLKI